MIRELLIVSTSLAVSGCVTVTAVSKEASEVMLYGSNQTAALEDCERLGPVRGSGSGWKPRLDFSSWEGVAEDAKNSLRVSAAKKYGADSVMLVGLDKQLTSVVAHGVAYRCFGTQTADINETSQETTE